MQEDTAERINEVLDELREIGDDETILVEGDKDRDALRSLGVTGSITVLNDGHSMVETSEMLSRSFEKVYIMTDWDRKGGQLGRALSEQLTALGVAFSTEERRKMAYLCKKDIKDVESLPALLERIGVENINC